MTIRQRILVAHGDPGIRSRYSQALLDAGYEVDEQGTAAACLDQARHWQPSVVAIGALPDAAAGQLCAQIKCDSALEGVFVVVIGAGECTRVSVDGVGETDPGPDDWVAETIPPIEFVGRMGLWLRLQATLSALRASEQSYRQLVDILPDASGVIDPQGKLLTVSRQTATMLGYEDPRELIGTSVLALASPEDHERIVADIKTVLNRGTVRNADYRVFGKEGSPMLWQVSAAQVPGEVGSPVKVLLLGRDVTEERRARAALAAQEMSFRKVLETALEGVWILDAAGRTTYVNESMAAMLGYSVAEIMGRHLFEFMDPVAREDADTKLKRRQHRVAERHDFRFRRKDGTKVWATLSTSPLQDESGRYIGALGMVADVTERKRAVDALAESELRYRTLIELSPDAIYINRGNRIVFANGSALRLFGAAKPEQLLGKSPFDLFHPNCHRDIRRRIELSKLGQTLPLIEQRIIRLDGRGADVVVATAGFTDNEGWAIEVILRDITEQKQAEAEMDSLRQKLSRVDRVHLVGELTAALAHELNQPLTAILSNAQAAERLLRAGKGDDEEIREILQDVVRDDLRAAEVIRGLRSLLGQSEKKFVAMDFNLLVRQTARLVESEALLSEVVLSLELSQDLPAAVGDRIQLQQVLLNLVTNSLDAMKSSPPGSRKLAISTSSNGEGFVTVLVRDTGHGILPGHLGRVFESFFTTKENGMGLGLGICRSIVQAHGGTIWARNNLDAGATFGFTVPIAGERKP